MLKSKAIKSEVKGTVSLTKDIGQFVAKASFADLTPEVLEPAKKAFMDCLGVTIAGSLEDVGKIIRDFVKETGGNPVSTVIGGGFRTSPALAALANGTMAHAMDYDDGGAARIPIHPSVSILPVALALGDSQGASGKDMLLAYILGVEIETKMTTVVPMSHFTRGWHPTATLGTLGATAAAAKLLKLKAPQIEMAMGIAASLAGGLRLNFGTMTKPLHAGNSAKNGIIAATLAKKGFTSAPDVLETSVGFLEVFCNKGEYSLNEDGIPLGKPFHIAKPGLGLKKYPSCRGTHQAISALSDILKIHKIAPQAVEIIECDYFNTGDGDEHLSRPYAQTPEEGKFSIEHCLGVLLMDGEVGLTQFTPDRLLDPAVQEMRLKVKLHPRKDLLPEKDRAGNLAARVTVKLKNGKSLSSFFCQGKAEMGIEWPWEDIIKKFDQCASTALPRNKIDTLINFVRNLEKVEKATQITDLVSKTAPRKILTRV